MKYLMIAWVLLLSVIPIGFVHADDEEVMAVQVTHAYVNSAPPVVKVTAGFFERLTGVTLQLRWQVLAVRSRKKSNFISLPAWMEE